MILCAPIEVPVADFQERMNEVKKWINTGNYSVLTLYVDDGESNTRCQEPPWGPDGNDFGGYALKKRDYENSEERKDWEILLDDYLQEAMRRQVVQVQVRLYQIRDDGSINHSVQKNVSIKLVTKEKVDQRQTIIDGYEAMAGASMKFGMQFLDAAHRANTQTSADQKFLIRELGAENQALRTDRKEDRARIRELEKEIVQLRAILEEQGPMALLAKALDPTNAATQATIISLVKGLFAAAGKGKSLGDALQQFGLTAETSMDEAVKMMLAPAAADNGPPEVKDGQNQEEEGSPPGDVSAG